MHLFQHILRPPHCGANSLFMSYKPWKVIFREMPFSHAICFCWIFEKQFGCDNQQNQRQFADKKEHRNYQYEQCTQFKNYFFH